MARYHVSTDGQPRPCTATKGACPLTDEAGASLPHGEFDSAEDARAFAEMANAAKFGGSFGTVSKGPDRSSIPPVHFDPHNPNLYPQAKPADKQTLRDIYEFEGAHVEDFADRQEFKNSSGDYRGPRYELTVTTEVFNDAGKLETSHEEYGRVVFRNEEQREDEAAEVLSDADREELASNSKLIREEWVTNNKRVTYFLTDY